MRVAPMSPRERERRGLEMFPCLTIEGAIRLVAVWVSLGRVAWWHIEEGEVRVYWSGNVYRTKR